MLNVQDIRNGTAFLMEGQPWIGLKYEHIKMGRGSATIKIKMKNLLTGAILEQAFINSARVEEIDLARKPMDFLYRDGDTYTFMDPKTYEQSEMTENELGENAPYLRDGLNVNILFWDTKPLWIELPPKMEFKVKETDPGVKGNSVSNLYKDAILENGLKTRVPLFINEGDRVIVDTRDGSYSERAK